MAPLGAGAGASKIFIFVLFCLAAVWGHKQVQKVFCCLVWQLLSLNPLADSADFVGDSDEWLCDDLDAEIADLSAHVDQGDALFHQLCQFDAQARRADFFSPANHQVCPLCVFECDVRS